MNNIDMYVFHQANLFILKHLIKIKFASEKVPISIDRYGNTSAVNPSNPGDALGNENQEPIRLLLCGYGRPVMGCIYLEMDRSVCRL